MSTFRVTPEQLQSTAAQLDAGAQQIESTNSQLQSKVAAVAADWEGAAKAQFDSLWQEWHTASKQMQHALAGISRLTKTAGINYEQTEAAVKSSFAG